MGVGGFLESDEAGLKAGDQPLRCDRTAPIEACGMMGPMLVFVGQKYGKMSPRVALRRGWSEWGQAVAALELQTMKVPEIHIV